uniref:RRM domain-containing protein n=1 Tax=Nelumbo nucifera TaxID=4432 RepID=A0A822XMT7_NELNU|nr:TPA_asm: hypothetical protein HUJ06_021974 [Nelumbo nucifera]
MYCMHWSHQLKLQIFVGGLDSNVTDEHLRQVFSQFGELVHVKIPVGKRCGFVQFANRFAICPTYAIYSNKSYDGWLLIWTPFPKIQHVDTHTVVYSMLFSCILHLYIVFEAKCHFSRLMVFKFT